MAPCCFFKGKLYHPLSPNQNNLACGYRPARLTSQNVC